MKKHKNKLIAAIAVIAILIIAFLYGGNSPKPASETPEPRNTATVTPVIETVPDELPQSTPLATEIPVEAPPEQTEAPTEEALIQKPGTALPITPEPMPVIEEKPSEPPVPTRKALIIPPSVVTEAPIPANIENPAGNEMVIDEDTGKDKYLTEPVPEGKPLPIEPQNAVISDKEFTCTLSVRCDTILNNLAWLDREKTDIVPEDGVIFAEKTVTFYEGESVFNLLVREMKRNKIHMEFENTPVYNSSYIEGIANLYEFDCGELSGWMYKVNGWFPNYGCSRYQLKPGDTVEWVYTCDLGADVGGSYSANTNR